MVDSEQYEDYDEADTGPSKSQRKRDMHALQALGEALVELREAQLEKLALPERLAEAVREAQRLRQRGARKRQLQFIGRLMREVEDAEAIRAGLEALQAPNRAEAAAHKTVEQWRERLLDDGDEALAALLQAYPAADRQQLRQSVRNARKEREAGRPPRAARELFRQLRALLGD